ncbi:thioredoxin family protein [uncultured Polaribacter sp.]|uniref:thioredoxin family protein n=1 Tax=uncultured Polaribacter sp. TaxID=174711 RepID=UPI002612F309|nr:thioredoxin family protein [uncultured Polaribacter sp.]
MRFYFILSCIVFASCSNTKQVINATKNKKGDLVGVANKESLKAAPYNVWFNKGYTNFKVDETTITAIEKNLKGVKIKSFMGTWCKDSKKEVPHFFKILEAANFNLKNHELITVNRNKKTLNKLEKGFQLLRVPTFIFYKDGAEIGRFVERPIETLEKDILKIVSGKPYKHAYDSSK